MFKIKRLVWILGCVSVLGGCTALPGEDRPAPDAGMAADVPRATGDAGSIYRLGRGYQEANDTTQAIAAYQKALTVDPDYVEAHNGLGVVYSLQGQHELALQHLHAAVRLAPLASHLHNNLGYAYLLQGRANEAADALEQALRLDPENQQARSNLAIAYERMGCTAGQLCGRWQDPGQP